MALFHVSSITWAESSSEEIINQDALQTSAYIEVPDGLTEDALHKFIDHALFELTTVQPWYYNLDEIKTIH
jgi:hypothetical protein